MVLIILCYFCLSVVGDKTLDGYQKKKYVCKLLFIFLLGHDIDFGHMEAVNLLSSNKYTEKQIVSNYRRSPIEQPGSEIGGESENPFSQRFLQKIEKRIERFS